MKVKIEKCYSPVFWYKDYIGKVFEVREGIGRSVNWEVVNPPKEAMMYVRKRNPDWGGTLYVCVDDCEDEFFIVMRNVLEEEE